MFALFFNLYLAMFRGVWANYTLGDIFYLCKQTLNAIGQLLTSIFNNVSTPMTDFGDSLLASVTYAGSSMPSWLCLVALVLALITSIGIVVMAVKGVKKAFGIFFMGIRRW